MHHVLLQIIDTWVAALKSILLLLIILKQKFLRFLSNNPMYSPLRLLQWNVRSITNKLWALRLLAHIYHPHLIFLQETWNFRDFPVKIPGYTFHEQHRLADNYGGIAVGIHTSLMYTHFTFPTPAELPHLQSQGISCSNFHFLNLYIPPDNIPSTEFWLHLYDTLPPNTVILGDANTRHPLLGGTKTNTAGSNLINSLSNTDYVYLNDGTPTRVTQPTQSTSAPDVTLLPLHLYLHSYWEVYFDPFGSDHYPIITTIMNGHSSVIPSQHTQFSTRSIPYIPSGLNWQLYTQTATELFNRSPVQSFSQIHTIIQNCASRSTLSPHPTRSQRHRHTPIWWTLTCQKWVNLRQK